MLKVSVNFFLNRDKRTKHEPYIYCYVRSKNSLLNLHTGERIKSEFWDVDKQQAKKSYIGSPELNNFLAKYKERILQIIRIAKTDNIDINFQELKDIIKKEVQGIEKHNFFDVYDTYINTKNPSVSQNTLKNLKVVKNHLLNFESFNKTKITFDSIDVSFFDNLQNYFISINHSNNNIKKTISFIKSFLNWSVERGYTSNIRFQSVKNLKENDVTQIALTKDELQRIINTNLPSNLERVRDCFLFQLYTGQRYSDVAKFDILDVKNDIWYFKQTKTSKAVEIPLITPTIAILNKYNYTLPLLTNQKMNEYLKEVGKLAKLDDVIKVTKTIGAEKVETQQLKYELITTHTARRTFVSLSAYFGLQNDVIKSMTGHSSDKMLSQYFKNNTNETKILIENLFSN